MQADDGAHPPYRFDSPSAALGAVLSRLSLVNTERVGLGAACGRVLAQEIVADRPSPASDVSAMDGFAVRAAELSAGELIVQGEIRIGLEPPALEAKRALRIVTGGAVPRGAEAVVKREDVVELPGRIVLRPGARAPAPGAHIRRTGENAPTGHGVAGPGREIDAGVAGAAACFGAASLRVHRVVRVGILVTGDELVPMDGAATAWQVRDSNAWALRTLLGRRAWIDVAAVERCADEPGALLSRASGILERVDMLLLTGGVSMGDRDFVAPMVRELGAEVVFHRLAQRPGKPLLACVTRDGKPVLGLPGNPVSALVTARRYGVSALARLGGVSGGPDWSQPVTLEHDDGAKLEGMWWHRLVMQRAPGVAGLVGGRGSGDIVSAAAAAGFIELPPGAGGPGPWSFFAWSW